MSGTLNGSSINGSNSPAWVVNASVVAAALAVVIGSVDAKRTTYGRATGNASVSVSVTDHKEVFGYVTGLASTSSDAEPTVTYAGSCNKVATAVGYATVMRLVPAEATGLATATGFILVAQALGEAEVTAGSAVVQADAHVVKYGKANETCGATSSVVGSDITRYATLNSPLCGAIAASVDASVQLSGDSFYYHDGYCDASGSCAGSIDPDKTDVITTIGIFDFGNSTADANAHVVHYGQSNSTASCASVLARAQVFFYPTADAIASATLAANATRYVLPTATLSAGAALIGIKAKIKYAGSAIGNASATAVKALGGKLLSGEINATAMAIANITATKIQYGSVTEAIANGLAGRAYAFSNADVRAPDDRYMIVAREDRSMVIQNEDRLMMVAA